VRRNTFALIAVACALFMQGAHACSPVVPQERIRQFIMTEQPSDLIVFVGKVVSVNEQRQADEYVVTETTLRPTKWWIGFRDGLVVVRTVTSVRSPCAGIGELNASVGGQWLIAGRTHYAVTGSWVELADGMQIEDGRIPRGLEQELRQKNAGG
jgi:hypothetical protein